MIIIGVVEIGKNTLLSLILLPHVRVCVYVVCVFLSVVGYNPRNICNIQSTDSLLICLNVQRIFTLNRRNFLFVFYLAKRHFYLVNRQKNIIIFVLDQKVRTFSMGNGFAWNILLNRCICLRNVWALNKCLDSDNVIAVHSSLSCVHFISVFAYECLCECWIHFYLFEFISMKKKIWYGDNTFNRSSRINFINKKQRKSLSCAKNNFFCAYIHRRPSFPFWSILIIL